MPANAQTSASSVDLREVEIGEEPVDHAERVSGLDEDARLLGASAHVTGSLGVARRLERANHRRADGEDRRLALARARDCRRERARHLEVLGVHRVIVEVVHRDRLERAEAYVQSARRDLAAARLEPLHERRREVKAGGRRGDRALGAGEDGLVALVVLGPDVALDVRRQRNLRRPSCAPRRPASRRAS